MRNVANAVLLAVLLAAHPAPAAAQAGGELVTEEARVSVLVDPKAGEVLGKVLLTLRNRTGRELEAVDLKIPGPYGGGASVEVVWDRNEELSWRRLVSDSDGGDFVMRVPLTRTLGDGKKVIVGVSFRVRFIRTEQDGSRVEPDAFSLTGAGWYPVSAADSQVPRRVRLSVRLPKDWSLTGPLKADRRHKGIALTEYAVKYDGEAAGRVVFAARAPGAE